MKRQDIISAKASGTELAWADGHTISTDWIGKQRLVRVQVLQVREGGEPLAPGAEYSARARARKRQVHIRLLEDSGRIRSLPEGTEVWVETRTLLATWPMYAEARGEHQQLQAQAAEAKATKDEIREAAKAQLDQLLAERGLEGVYSTGTPEHFHESVTTARVTLTLAQVQQLLGS